MADDAQEPVSLDEAKAHLRVDGTDDDELINALIIAARGAVEGETGLVLTPREVREAVRQLGYAIDIETWPIADPEAISISYLDEQGQAQKIDPASWYANMNARPIRICSIGSWDGAACVGRPATLTIQAGWTAEEVPQTIKAAMKLIIGDLYANREGTIVGASAAAISIPTVQLLLQSWKVARI